MLLFLLTFSNFVFEMKFQFKKKKSHMEVDLVSEECCICTIFCFIKNISFKEYLDSHNFVFKLEGLKVSK